MSGSDRRPAAAGCDLGVTGKRVRRALPAVAPPPAFRAELGRRINQRLLEAAPVQAMPGASNPQSLNPEHGTH
jgi:hypothetical protein